MTTLRDFGIDLEGEIIRQGRTDAKAFSESRKYTSDFDFRSRHICHYLKRHVRPKRIQTNGFRIICLTGYSSEREGCPIVGEAAVDVPFIFDRAFYESLKPEQTHEYFLALLDEGFRKCARHHEIPLDYLLELLQQFRAGGYRNEWVHHRKLLRGFRLRATLHCSFDMERFLATLSLERKGKVVYKVEALRTKPHEIMFHHDIRSLALDGNLLILRDPNPYSKPTLTVDLSTIV